MRGRVSGFEIEHYTQVAFDFGSFFADVLENGVVAVGETVHPGTKPPFGFFFFGGFLWGWGVGGGEGDGFFAEGELDAEISYAVAAEGEFCLFVNEVHHVETLAVFGVPVEVRVVVFAAECDDHIFHLCIILV